MIDPTITVEEQMPDFQLETPVVFIIFKRPDTTEKVFEAIRQAKPPKLLVIADGSRSDKPGEAEKCAAAREIIDRVDWDCEILKNYSEINLGCAKRVSSGLDWVFEQVPEAIILEDDCLPHPTFFRFCEELLKRYRYDERIASISGQNVQLGRNKTEYSYYFSRYPHIWGWATWRRSWQYYDFDMKLWPEIKAKNLLRNILQDPEAKKCWSEIFQSTYEHDKRIDNWDFQWTFSCWVESKLSILANVNLISNTGFGLESTNTNNEKSLYSNLAVEAIEFPMKHPPYVIRDTQADRFTQKTLFNYLGIIKKIGVKIERFWEIWS
nr:glycosyltransferase family 2 protein [Pleurocapsa sp. FMAR1]